MKKKMLIVANSLHIGGIERSLVNLLCCLDYSKYDVDLFLYSNSGEYIKEIPKSVNLINKSWLLKCIGLSMSEAIDTKNILVIIFRALLAVACRIIGSRIVFSFIFNFLPKYNGYDVAVSFVHNVHPKTLYFGHNLFVLKKVRANRKVAWIHSDYIRAGFNYPSNNDEYRKFHAIVNVSYSGKDIFDQTLPDLKGRSYVVYNTNPISKIKELANKGGNPYQDIDSIKVVSVGRIDLNKSFDRVLIVAEQLIREGYSFNWYILGDGPQKDILKEKCNELNLQNNIHFVGSKKNPYPYIKYADIFVLTSKYEGMPMVVSEAQILGTPIISTGYAAASEQIVDGRTGIIVDNSEEGLYQGIKKVLNDENILQELKLNLKSTTYSNDKALSQFEKVTNN